MKNSTLRLYDLLISKNFDKEEAASFIEEVESTVTKKFEENVNILATKKDLEDVKQDLKKDISDLKDNMNSMFWKITGVILAQMGLIFAILKLVGVFD
jgi:transcription elongation factor